MKQNETDKYNYNLHGSGYNKYRHTEPKIAEKIFAALGTAKTVLNVGAGSGSYEPQDKYVVAVEPSAVMRSMRADDSVPAIDAIAENLPFDDNSFDASMAVLTIHH